MKSSVLQKKYETERLVLVQSEAALAPRVVAFYQRNQAFLLETEPTREKPFYTEAFQRRALARDLAGARGMNTLRLWLLPKEDPANGEIIGTAALGNIVFGSFRSAFLSYKLDGDKTGQGYMSEALRRLIDIAFTDIGLHRLEANIMPRNGPSLRLVQRLGFEEEGLARKYLQINGLWEDHVHMVLLNPADDEEE